MANRATLSKENIIAAIEQYSGNITNVAKHFAVTRQTIYDHIEREAEIKVALEDARDAFIDFVEEALKKRIKAGDTTAIIFTLKTQGKKRGYVEKQEMDVTSGGEKLTAPIVYLPMIEDDVSDTP